MSSTDDAHDAHEIAPAPVPSPPHVDETRAVSPDGPAGSTNRPSPPSGSTGQSEPSRLPVDERHEDLGDQPVEEPPATGDDDLDAALGELAQAQNRSFEERVDTGERVHRLLQGRLGDLGRA
jgi:hypothetical protein